MQSQDHNGQRPCGEQGERGRLPTRHARAITGLALLLAGCAMGGAAPPLSAGAPVAPADPSIRDFPVKLGTPFKVGDTLHTPEAVASYDAVGYAHWYRGPANGAPTFSGEPFLAHAYSGSHKTLPIPSYVEVTSLDTGVTILVRINDRGPMTNNRILDLSPNAAHALGMGAQPLAVRVRKVNPPESEKAMMRAGHPGAERIPTPDSLLRVLRRKLNEQGASPNSASPNSTSTTGVTGAKTSTDKRAPTPQPVVAERERDVMAPQAPIIIPATPTTPKPAASAPTPAASPAPTPAASPATPATKAPVTTAPKPSAPAALAPNGAPVPGRYIQLGAFSSKATAETLARQVGGLIFPGGGLYRVRTGPYKDEASANQALAEARAKGYSGAQIVAVK